MAPNSDPATPKQSLVEETEDGTRKELTLQRCQPKQVNMAAEGIRLPPGTANALREAATTGKKGLGRAFNRSGDDAMAVVLEPTKETAKQLKAGTAYLTKAKDKGADQVLAQARDAKTGDIVENISFKAPKHPTKAAQAGKAAGAGAAVAWQAMAIATQQHYLVEISGKLDSIEQGVSEIIKRQLNDKAANLATTEEDLARVEEHIRQGAELTDNDRQDVQEWHREARHIHNAAIKEVRAIWDDPKRDTAEALPDLVLADHAVRVAARCSATLLRMPYKSSKTQETDFWHYAAMTKQAMSGVDDLITYLDQELTTRDQEWREYQVGRPKRKPKQAWNLGPGRIKPLHAGPQQPKFEGLRNLSSGHRNWIKQRVRLAATPIELPSAIVVIEGEEARLISGTLPDSARLEV